MKKIYVPMIRFGDKEFDEGYVGWGFNSYDEQMRDAVGVMSILRKPAMKILDLGCGLAIYHKAWLDKGHTVVGIDISETFILMANNANDSYKNASYRCENFETLEDENEYDCVTMIDTPLEDPDIAKLTFRALKPGGHLLFQVGNAYYKHPRGPLFRNSRNWQENEDRTFLLTRHEYDEGNECWVDEEWSIDIEKDEIVVQHNHSRNLAFKDYVEMLTDIGFATVFFCDVHGKPAEYGASEAKNYFCVAYKGEI
ncbi:SAM-dependent methyltransferase [Clostridia bacterium]|nr:SAM-dependent methyltransferase [Clostridia bacterium]